jgi:hypothetical protein
MQKVRSTLDGLDMEVKTECSKFSEDVKYWAEFQTGIKVGMEVPGLSNQGQLANVNGR